MLFSLLVFHCLAFTVYPQRWKGLYLPIKATLNLRHSAVSIWKFFLHEPFTRPLQAMVCQELSNFPSLLQRSLAGMKKAPPSHPNPSWRTLTAAYGQQVGRREEWEAVEVGISFLCSRSLFFLGHSLASGSFFSLDGIDGRINKYSH